MNVCLIDNFDTTFAGVEMGTRRGSRDVLAENPACGLCDNDIRLDNGDTSLQCELCQYVFHFTCLGISRTTYNDIKKPDSEVMFFCKFCKGTAKTLVATLGNLNKKYDALEARFSALEGRINAGPDTDQVFSSQSVDASNVGVQNTASMIEATLNELQDQKRRECNLMIFGLRETDDEDQEKSGVQGLLNAVGIEPSSLISMQRLGHRSTNKPRAVKLHMSSSEPKRVALSNAKSLKSSDAYKFVYVKPDLTAMQLKKQRALVDALKAANNSGKKMVIRQGRLVPLEAGASGHRRT